MTTPVNQTPSTAPTGKPGKDDRLSPRAAKLIFAGIIAAVAAATTWALLNPFETSPAPRPTPAGTVAPSPEPSDTPTAGQTDVAFDGQEHERTDLALAVVAYATGVDYLLGKAAAIDMVSTYLTSDGLSVVRGYMDEQPWDSAKADQRYRYTEPVRDTQLALTDTTAQLRVEVLVYESTGGQDPTSMGTQAWLVDLVKVGGDWRVDNLVRD